MTQLIFDIAVGSWMLLLIVLFICEERDEI